MATDREIDLQFECPCPTFLSHDDDSQFLQVQQITYKRSPWWNICAITDKSNV